MSNKQSFHDREESKERVGSQKLSAGSFSYLDFILAHNKTTPRVDFSLGSQNQAMLRLEETVKYTIGSGIPILISGEEGVGKTYMAKKIHKAEASLQRGSLLLIDCQDFQSRGAEFFKQLFDEKNSSMDEIRTIILKEVSYLDLSSQSYVLKFLQQSSENTNAKKPRLVTTSSKDLYELVEKGLFQQDLYYRLYVLQLRVPSLKERSDDLENLLCSLLLEMGKENDLEKVYRLVKKSIEERGEAFSENITSLKAFIKENLFPESNLLRKEEPQRMIDAPKASESPVAEWLKMVPKDLTMKDIETQIILEVLKNHHGNRTHTARSLGISLRTLRNKINEYLQKGYSVTKPQK